MRRRIYLVPIVTFAIFILSAGLSYRSRMMGNGPHALDGVRNVLIGISIVGFLTVAFFEYRARNRR